MRPEFRDSDRPAALDTQAAAVALRTSPANVRVLGHRGVLRRLPGTDGSRRALWLLEDVERLAEGRVPDSTGRAV